MTPLSCLWTAASGAQSPHSSPDWNYLSGLSSYFESAIPASPLTKISAKDLAEGSSQAGQGLSQYKSSRRETKTGPATGLVLLGLVQAWCLLDQVSILTKSQLFTWEISSYCFVPASCHVFVTGDEQRVHIVLRCKCLLHFHKFCASSWTTWIPLHVSFTSSLGNISVALALLSNISSPCLILCI